MAEEHDAAILRVKRFLSDCGLAVTWGEARGAVQAARASPPEPDALKLAEMMLLNIKRFGELGCIQLPCSFPDGKKPPSKEVWQFPRHMLTDIDEALAAIRAAQHSAAPEEEQAHG